ncbi:MAG: tetratricopeptide repeat protein [bacterium]
MEKDKLSKKFELLALHIEMFKNAFAGYIEYYESLNKKPSEKNSIESKDAEPDKFMKGIAALGIADIDICGNAGTKDDGLSNLLFEEIICNYYETVISALKKLAKYDKKYLKLLVKTHEELWKSAPKLKDKDYLSPYLSDLCRFLYEIKETGTLTFFYNLLIYCREIPFLSLQEEQEKYLVNLYAQNEEKDPFGEFREERKKRIIDNFDEGLFNKTYDKFFLILSGWNEKSNGYYTRDEIFFMNGLFILDELIDYVYFEEKNRDWNPDIPETNDGGGRDGDGRINGQRNKLHNGNDTNKKPGAAPFPAADKNPITGFYADKCNGMFQEVIEPNGRKNIYRYACDDATKEKISCFYEKALRYFNRAIHYNPNNPRYYYEYARCLKNSGKSEEAEIFFKKAFDLNG